jgi:D-alanyl-D-alanine carboxypeptidase/D-alanyl-D-alanine-endopeptidase (penicillin-binding protein 4)
MKHFLVIIPLFFGLQVSAQLNSYPSFLAEFLQDNIVKNASVSICVADANTDSILLETNPQLCVLPASAQKLITSATALEILGGRFQFATYVWANGEIANGKLTGDLIITGGGDPTLGSGNFGKKDERKKFLSEWASLIKKAGIDTITGNIVADPYIFNDQDVPGSWLWEDLGNHYGAVATGISIYDNIFEIAFNVPKFEGLPTNIVKTTPEIPGLTLKNEVLSSAIKSDNAYVFGSPFNTYRVVKGTLPTGSANYTVKASVPDPALLLASELKKVLSDSSVIVNGNIDKQKLLTPDKIDTGKIVALWLSTGLFEIVELMNKESINLYAETLLKQIGLMVSGNGSTLAGTKAMKEFWAGKGIDTNNLFLEDGSGMSRKNAITAQTLVEVMVFMKKQSQWFDDFQKSIPLTGIEGTQRYYFQESVLKGKARAKTGSMTRVRSMAGYMTTQRGKEISFAIMVNNFNGPSSNMVREMEKLMEAIYKNL